MPELLGRNAVDSRGRARVLLLNGSVVSRLVHSFVAGQAGNRKVFNYIHWNGRKHFVTRNDEGGRRRGRPVQWRVMTDEEKVRVRNEG